MNYEKIDIYFKNNKIGDKTITMISREIGVSPSAVSRYAERKGFKGFKDFKFYLQRRENASKSIGSDEQLNNLIFSLSRTNDLIKNNEIDFVANKINTKRKVVILGEAFTYMQALFFQRLLLKINIEAVAINVASDLSLTMPNNDAVFIFISNSGKNPNIRKAALKIKSTNESQFICSISGSADSNIDYLSNVIFTGYSISSGLFNSNELPTYSSFTTNLIISKIYDVVYELDKEKNDILIANIAKEKE